MSLISKEQVEDLLQNLRHEFEEDELKLAKKVDEQMSFVKERIEAVAQDTKALEAFVAGKLNMINPYGMEKVGSDLDRKIRELGEKVSDVQTATGAYGHPCPAARIQSLEHSEKDIRQQLADAQQGALAQAGELSGLAAKVRDLEKLDIQSSIRCLQVRLDGLQYKSPPVVPATADDRVRMLEAKLQMFESEHKTTAQALESAQIQIMFLKERIQDPYGLSDYFRKEEVGADTSNAEVRKRLRVGWK